MNPNHILDFARESNAIEGLDEIARNMSHAKALEEFLALDGLDVPAVVKAHQLIEPSAKFRDHDTGMRIRIANHIPPPDGIMIRTMLEDILEYVNNDTATPFENHVAFELLHPFTDGNGRVGRLIWAWEMVNNHQYDLAQGFLHIWYYQSLEDKQD